MPSFYDTDAEGRHVLTTAGRNRLKLAARELRRLTGMTLEEIAARTQASKSQWHNYESVDAPDLIPVHVYLPLELELGQAPVTRAIAAMQGLVVTTDADMAQRLEVTELMGQAARESGEALAILIEAGADGKISRTEAKQIAEQWGDLGRLAERVKQFASRILSAAG
ncbi:MAG TPA: hypothetical protein VEZ12_20880 [Herpetosiphonaceae bacterium]|nr:hypothetical protein [Herpetosiphonaceae bacterium]